MVSVECKDLPTFGSPNRDTETILIEPRYFGSEALLGSFHSSSIPKTALPKMRTGKHSTHPSACIRHMADTSSVGTYSFEKPLGSGRGEAGRSVSSLFFPVNKSYADN